MNWLQSRAWLVTCVRNQLITDARRIYSHQTRRISHASAVRTSHRQTLSYRKQLRVEWCKEPTVIIRPLLTPWRPLLPYLCILSQTGLSRSFVIFDTRALWRSGLSVRVPGCRKLQMTGLNPVWHRMLYSCTYMATVGVKGLRFALTRTACLLLAANCATYWRVGRSSGRYSCVMGGPKCHRG